jgi:hypothetical protein
MTQSPNSPAHCKNSCPRPLSEFRYLEKRTGFSSSTLNDAIRGKKVPTYDTARAIVEACGGRWDDWTVLWRAANKQALARKEARRQAARSSISIEPRAVSAAVR